MIYDLLKVYFCFFRNCYIDHYMDLLKGDDNLEGKCISNASPYLNHEICPKPYQNPLKNKKVIDVYIVDN